LTAAVSVARDRVSRETLALRRRIRYSAAVRALLALFFALMVSARAQAYDFSIDAETIGQAYQLRAADDALVNRRRITQYLGLHIFNMGPRDDLGRPLPNNQFYVTASLRFDADAGDFPSLTQLTGYTQQHEIFAEKLDLLYAFIGGNNIAGLLDFKLGRQIMVDLYDWYAFDGLHLQVRSPFYVAAELWGGLNVSGASPIDSPVYRVDGVALGGNPMGSLGAREEDALQPTVGVALRLFGLRDVSARASYFRTFSFTGAPLSKGESSLGVVDEKVGLTAQGRLFDGRIIPWFSFRYNLLVGRLDEIYAGARAQVGRHGISAEYVLSAPTFDGDSIWNVFGTYAFDDVRIAYDVTIKRVRLYARAFTRLYFYDRGTADTTLSAAYGGNVGGRWDFGRGYVRLDSYFDDGYGGRRTGIDAAGRLRLFGNPQDGMSLETRLSFADFVDDSRPIDSAESFGAQAGLRWAPVHGLILHGLVEENVNRLYKSQLRVLLVADLSFFLAQKPYGLNRLQPWSGF
jgi:hypothetical protein